MFGCLQVAGLQVFKFCYLRVVYRFACLVVYRFFYKFVGL